MPNFAPCAVERDEGDRDEQEDKRGNQKGREQSRQ